MTRVLLFLLLFGFVSCAKPDPVQAAFQKCTDNITNNLKTLENQPKAIQDAAKIVADIGVKACDLIKTSCADKNSDLCKTVLEQYK